MAEETTDLTALQRRMAVQCNNRAWDLWEIDAPEWDELNDMVHSAHAAYLYWSEVGTGIHRLRAWMTLAYAHIRGGSLELAERYLGYAEELLIGHPDGLCDWDEPFLLDARARLYEARGEDSPATEYRIRAEQAGGRIADQGDRDQFFSIFRRNREGVPTE